MLCLVKEKKWLPLRLRYFPQPRHNLVVVERREAEARAARLQRRDDFAQVVADYAETNVLRVLLDYCNLLLRVRGQEILFCTG